MPKVVLVTGAGRRLGAAIALACLDKGWAVALHCHRSRKGAEALANGRRAIVLQGDLRKVADCKRVLREAVRRLGRLDALVNSAANFRPAVPPRVSEKDWDDHLDLNLKGSFFLAQEAAKVMQAAGRGGAIVQITDANRDWRRYAAYGISKAAAEAMVRVLRRSLAPRIRVSAVAPGQVRFPHGARRVAAAVLRKL